jgi:alpha-tubulin suppressor-like RCC1 family protein
MAVAAGNDHSLALKTDGRVVAWGDGSNGLRPVPLAAQSGVVAVAAGVYHDLAQWAGGRLVAWGHNLYGQCNAPPLGRDLAPASLLLSD